MEKYFIKKLCTELLKRTKTIFKGIDKNPHLKNLQTIAHFLNLGKICHNFKKII